MGNQIEKINNSIFKSKWESKIRKAEVCLVISFFVLFVLFCVFQYRGTIDVSIWGICGDFIGGLYGTVVAYISLRLLVNTLKEQEKSNSFMCDSNNRSREVSELQLVHEHISTLLESYNRVINSYEFVSELGSENGREAIKDIANSMFYEFKGSGDITDRIDEARKSFDTKYIKYRECMSVHYRLLFQIFQIIGQSDLKGKKKAMLSKMIRSQFSEDELLLLRYNCLTDNGRKMRNYVNQFNLLKHLPLTRLLEFKKWVEALESVQKNRLDTECIAIKKSIKNLLGNDIDRACDLKYSSRYQGLMKVSEDKKEFRFEIVRSDSYPSSIDETSMDKVLDNWKDENIKDFFVDFFKYVFDYSNYSQFNKVDDLNIKCDIRIEESGKKHTVWISVKKVNSPLVINMPYDVDPYS